MRRSIAIHSRTVAWRKGCCWLHSQGRKIYSLEMPRRREAESAPVETVLMTEDAGASFHVTCILAAAVADDCVLVCEDAEDADMLEERCDGME